MECHTWAYRALKENEFEKARKELLDRKLKRVCSFARQANSSITEDEQIERIIEDFKGAYGGKGVDKKLVGIWIKHDTECVDDLMACTNLSELCRVCEKNSFGVAYKIVNGRLYAECGFDEPVRIYGYPEETFTDADEFINWIRGSEEKCGKPISEYVIYDIDGKENLCMGYSEKMAELIKHFWKKYDNEVYVEFG